MLLISCVDSLRSCVTLLFMDYDGMSFVIFFFKQKTAYEMRISDWSSDVCSSDLQPCIGTAEGLDGLHRMLPRRVRIVHALQDAHRCRDSDAGLQDAVPTALVDQFQRIFVRLVGVFRRLAQHAVAGANRGLLRAHQRPTYRKSGVLGKSVSARLDTGGVE